MLYRLEEMVALELHLISQEPELFMPVGAVVEVT
jgi:hypothetical protein